MSELRSVLKIHGQRYRLMQPADAVKLIYQNEFGGGHLIRDEESCLLYLRKEHAAVGKDPNAPLYEAIGNGLVRVNLAAVKPEDLEQLGKHFLRSAARHTGSLDRFVEKLELLRQLTREGYFAFGMAELEQYLYDYEKAGYPMVSHSQIYRQQYHPAYRVVLAEPAE